MVEWGMERQEFGERKRDGEILINHEEYPKQKSYSEERMDMKNSLERCFNHSL